MGIADYRFLLGTDVGLWLWVVDKLLLKQAAKNHNIFFFRTEKY